MKTTLREIKNFGAIDITNWSNEALYKLYDDEHGFTTIAYAHGIYGCNGKVVRGYTSNTLYKVTSRSNALYIVG